LVLESEKKRLFKVLFVSIMARANILFNKITERICNLGGRVFSPIWVKTLGENRLGEEKTKGFPSSKNLSNSEFREGLRVGF
jgi:hypothetical protein